MVRPPMSPPIMRAFIHFFMSGRYPVPNDQPRQLGPPQDGSEVPAMNRQAGAGSDARHFFLSRPGVGTYCPAHS